MVDIILLMGVSKAGKDTLYRALVGSELGQTVKLFNHKVVGFSKRQWELEWGLPHGALELPEVKNMVIPGHPQGWRYIDLMVHLAKEYALLNRRPQQLARFKQDTQWLLDNGFVPVFTDVRMPDEMSHIIDLHIEGHRVLPFLLSRDGCVMLDSDKHLFDNMSTLANFGIDVIELTHNGSLDELTHDVYRCYRGEVSRV